MLTNTLHVPLNVLIYVAILFYTKIDTPPKAKTIEVWGLNSPHNAKILNCKIETDFAEKHSFMEVSCSTTLSVC